LLNLQSLLRAKANKFDVPGLVIGSAPTINRLHKMEFQGIRIGVGDIPWRAPEFGPYDYWVTANTIYPLPWKKKHLQDIHKSKATTLISSASVALLKDGFGDVLNTLKLLPSHTSLVYFDQRHFNGSKCAEIANCCRFSESLVQDVPIQELLNELISKSGPAYTEGSTVAIHGYALAVLLRCNPIYLIGIELPTTISGYKAYKNYRRREEAFKSKMWRLLYTRFPFLKKGDSDFGGATRNEILVDFQAVAKIATGLNIRTYSLSESSPLNSVNGIEYSQNPS